MGRMLKTLKIDMLMQKEGLKNTKNLATKPLSA